MKTRKAKAHHPIPTPQAEIHARLNAARGLGDYSHGPHGRVIYHRPPELRGCLPTITEYNEAVLSGKLCGRAIILPTAVVETEVELQGEVVA